jgi:hypothetical protein
VIKDVSDFFDAGGTTEEFLELARQAEDYVAPDPQASRASASPSLSSNGSAGSSEAGAFFGLPRISLGKAKLRDLTRKFIDALAARNHLPFLFVRHGRIARVLIDEGGHPTIQDLDQHMLRGECARAADCGVWTDEGWKDLPPPMEVVMDLLSRGPAEWPFPPVERINRTPTFRPDFSLITKAGYDAATRSFYVPGPGMEHLRVPANPTRDECVRARKVIDDVIAQFPFADKASRTHVFAGLFTVNVRNLILGFVPAMLITAPAYGSGKTLLADAVIARITTGEPAALYSLPRDDEELRKQITTALLAGSAVIVWDNVTYLDSSQMSKLLTTDVWGDRFLGSMRDMALPVRSSFFITGNNVKLGGDMPRRVFKCHLDAQVSHPFKRHNFRYKNLREHVAGRRPELVEAALTMVMGWIQAGKPKPKSLPVMGSYEAWVEIIGSILAWNELEDFLGNSEELHADDTDRQEWAAFLAVLAEVLPGTFSTADVIEKIVANLKVLRDALPGPLRQKINDPGLSHKLGNAFRSRVDERFGDDGIRLTKEGKSHSALLWKVVREQPVTYEVSDSPFVSANQDTDQPSSSASETPGPDPSRESATVSTMAADGNGFTVLALKVGDQVQWKSNGARMFLSPQSIAGFSNDGKFAYFEAVDQPVPVVELTPVSAAAEDTGDDGAEGQSVH